MSGQIRKDDIIQHKEIQDAFAELAKSVKPFIDNIEQAADVTKQLNEILKENSGFKDLINNSKKVNENTKTYIKNTKEFNSLIKLGQQQLKEKAKAEREAAKATDQAAKAEKRKNDEMQRSKTALETQRSKAYAQQLKKQEQETKLLINAEKAAAGSKQKLVAQNKLLEFRMRNLNTLIPEQRTQYERLRSEVNANNQKMADMGQKTGGLRGAFSNMIKSIGLYAAAIFGLSRLIQFFTRDLLEMTKRLDSLDFSMKTIIKSQEEYAQTQIFLSNTAKNYGQDILTLTERYIKFRAAAQQSNMSVRDTQQIFDSTAKAAAVLGLKTDEVNGVFLALEQMISKGKVTTEELRRQLGERLPGAFGIMADAIGVSIVELDKMLKAGDVLSTEALPKFAVALEKAYGIESVEKVDTLAAAHGRLRTSWVEFVDSLNANKTYITVLESATKLISSLNPKSQSEQVSIKLLDNIEKIKNEASKLNTEQERGNYLQNEHERLNKDILFQNEQLKKDEEELNKIRFKWGSVARQNLLEGIIKQREIQILAARKTAIEIRNIYNDIVIGEQNDFKVTPFDVSDYKSKLDEASNEFETFTSTTDAKLKESFKGVSTFIKDNIESEKDYLLAQKALMNTNAEESYKLYSELAANEANLTKEQKEELLNRYNNYQNYVEAQLEIEKRLGKINKPGTSVSEKDDTVNIIKEQQQQELEALKAKQQIELRTQEEHLRNTIQNDDDYQAALEDQKATNNQNIIQLQIDHQNQLLELVKEGSLEEAKILSDREKLYADSEKNITEAQIAERERGIKKIQEILKNEQKQREEQSKLEYDALYDSIVQSQTDRLNAANEDIKNSKGKANTIRDIENNLALDLLQIEEDKINQKLIDGQLEFDEQKKLNERLIDIERDRASKELDITKQTEQQKAELRQLSVQKANELVNEGFNFLIDRYSKQQDALDKLYQFEIDLAGTNTEQKILAERKYEREKRKIQLKQARAEKAQAAFGIIVNAAQAVVSMLKEPFPMNIILSALVGGIGAVQLATVLSEPIPAFAKGTDDAPETFIAGEKGQELIITPKGETMLTPDKATLFSDSSLVGSTILPHDETQKWLANYAVNQTYDMIDMSESNKHLKGIRNDLKNKSETYFENGHRIVKRGSITTRYAR